MSEIIFLSNVCLSFPHLVEPHASTEGGIKKYSADLILSLDNPALTQFMTRYAEMASQKWGEHANQVMTIIQADRKLRCYGSGAEKIDKKTFKPYSGYDGKAYISANKDQAPQMIQQDGTSVDAGNTMAYQALARKLYGGCYVNAAVKPWLQENKHGRGIRCDLVAIQFFQDGTPFGEGVADASSMFGAVAGVAAAPTAAPAMPGMPFTPSFLQ